MVLKPNRHVAVTDISFFMNTTGNRGRVVVHSTSGSGIAMDQSNAVVASPGASASGTQPAGLLLNDVVNYDLTRQHLNQHRDEVQLGSKVTLLRQGWVVTNNITGTVTAGQSAYYTVGGMLTATNPADSGDWPAAVGRFLSSADADGYAKVEINVIGGVGT
jgi:hypothetical protein